MKFLYIVLLSLTFAGCDSNSDRAPIAKNNPSSLRAIGPASALDQALSAAVESASPTINPSAACPAEISGFLRGQSVECGALKVPEDHRATSARSLAVGYLKAPSVFDSSKPLLVLEQGGPGGSSMMLAAMYLMMNGDLSKKFNILAVEQRGTPWTFPVATCDDVIDVEAQFLEQTIDPALGGLAMFEANERCLKRASQSMDISRISTYQIAKDIVFAADEMGFTKFNYYGVSYGTVVGQYLLKYSEQHLDNVVLDSPAVVGKLWMNDAIENMDSLAAAKFESYRAKYLAALSTDEAIVYFKEAAAVFDQKALVTPITVGAKKINVVVDSAFYMDIVFRMLIMYPDDQIVKMLLDASQTAKTNPEQAKMVFGFLLPQLQLVGQNVTSIMYQSIICREFSFADLDMDAAVKNWTFMPKLLGQDIAEQYSGEMNICNLNIPKADEDVILSAPVQSNKPVLVVGGEYDHVTNPRYVTEVAVDMPNAHTTVFEDAAHGVFVSAPCITKSITDYLLSSNGGYTNECL